jgi:hypothetical protein
MQASQTEVIIDAVKKVALELATIVAELLEKAGEGDLLPAESTAMLVFRWVKASENLAPAERV